jgi:hypothetical protein
MSLRKLIIGSALLGAVIWSGSSAGALLPANADGWHTWQVDESGASTTMCCYAGIGSKDSHRACNLDGRHLSFSNNADCAAAPGTVQVYVRMIKGEPKDIRVLSSNCPVTAESEIQSHGVISATENVNWFRKIIEDRKIDKSLREEALFGLVQSNSDEAYVYIDSLLSQR